MLYPSELQAHSVVSKARLAQDRQVRVNWCGREKRHNLKQTADLLLRVEIKVANRRTAPQTRQDAGITTQEYCRRRK